MNLEEFLSFIDKTIDELILYGELHAGSSFLGHELTFEWETYERIEVHGKENIIYEIADKVYVDEDKIFPCVDLIITKPQTTNKTLKIYGRRAGYEPRPFGRGWSNRPGPFIYGIGEGIMSRSVDSKSTEFQTKLRELGLIHYPLKNKNGY